MLKMLYLMVIPIGKTNKITRMFNRIITKIANIIMPIYYKKTTIKQGTEENSKKKIIVSLTTYPARINKVWITIQSLLRQTEKPNKVILWIANTQFDDIDKLPKKLKELQAAGLEIKFCDDIKSYKKFIYTARENCDKIIITADDDVIYPNDWVERLYDTYVNNKTCVCTYRAHTITFDKENKIKEYNLWDMFSNGEKGPSHMLFATGVGGILYPPNFFSEDVLDIDNIQRMCPTTDDVWLKVMELKKNVKVVKVDSYSKEWFCVSKTQKTGLIHYNRTQDVNGKKFKELLEFYKIDIRRYTSE